MTPNFFKKISETELEPCPSTTPHSVHEAWEYRASELVPGTFNPRKGYEKSLNQEGIDGWELVTILTHDPEHLMGIYKRKRA